MTASANNCHCAVFQLDTQKSLITKRTCIQGNASVHVPFVVIVTLGRLPMFHRFDALFMQGIWHQSTCRIVSYNTPCRCHGCLSFFKTIYRPYTEHPIPREISTRSLLHFHRSFVAATIELFLVFSSDSQEFVKSKIRDPQSYKRTLLCRPKTSLTFRLTKKTRLPRPALKPDRMRSSLWYSPKQPSRAQPGPYQQRTRLQPLPQQAAIAL